MSEKNQHLGSSLEDFLKEEGITKARGFRTTLLKRSQDDAGFRPAMLKEGIDIMLAGDVETGKAILRDYINGTKESI